MLGLNDSWSLHKTVWCTWAEKGCMSVHEFEEGLDGLKNRGPMRNRCSLGTYEPLTCAWRGGGFDLKFGRACSDSSTGSTPEFGPAEVP